MAAAPRLMTIHDYYATPETLAPVELAYGVLRRIDSRQLVGADDPIPSAVLPDLGLSLRQMLEG